MVVMVNIIVLALPERLLLGCGRAAVLISVLIGMSDMLLPPLVSSSAWSEIWLALQLLAFDTSFVMECGVFTVSAQTAPFSSYFVSRLLGAAIMVCPALVV